MKIYFAISGEPQGKARPRVVRTKNGSSHTYTPGKTVAYEKRVQMCYIEATGGYTFPKGVELSVAIEAFYAIPQSKSKKQRALMSSGEIRPTKKPDWDNIGKIICDSLNGIAYSDDAQIVIATVAKYYTANSPYVTVTISEAAHDP